jgi:amidohydrolase
MVRRIRKDSTNLQSIPWRMMRRMTNVSELKALAGHRIDEISEELIELSDYIGANPELGHQEVKAAEATTRVLKYHGLKVAHGIAGLKTALHAEVSGFRDRPRVSILGEYDALPDVGHGCGHNIIGSAAVGALLGVQAVIAQLPGTVAFFGTPSEESAVPNAGGKVVMVNAGVFDDTDAVLMMHPSTETRAWRENWLAARGFDFKFYGKSAHAAGDPHKGINALDSVILTFNGINALRQHVKSDVRIHGVVTSGGGSPNVVPAFASCRFRVRSELDPYLAEVVDKVLNIARGAALMTGARLEIEEYANPYQNNVPNDTLADILELNMSLIGLKMTPPPKEKGRGSNDLGNVAHRVPSIQAAIAIAEEGECNGHSLEFAAAAMSERGHASVIAGAKAMAYTAIDILLDPELLARAKKELSDGLSAEAAATKK